MPCRRGVPREPDTSREVRMKGLTKRQQQILAYIGQHTGEHGYPPTVREIALFMGIKSPNGVNDHLHALEKKGFLVRDEKKSRGLTLKIAAPPSPPPKPEVQSELIRIPIIGQVAAGVPILAEQNVSDTMQLDRRLLGRHGSLFGLRIRGTSMIEDGIFEGDYVFVRPQSTAKRGEIVVALIDGEATVKRFYHEGDRIRLQPANANMSPIIIREGTKEVRILGVVVHSFRSF